MKCINEFDETSEIEMYNLHFVEIPVFPEIFLLLNYHFLLLIYSSSNHHVTERK